MKGVAVRRRIRAKAEGSLNMFAFLFLSFLSSFLGIFLACLLACFGHVGVWFEMNRSSGKV